MKNIMICIVQKNQKVGFAGSIEYSRGSGFSIISVVLHHVEVTEAYQDMLSTIQIYEQCMEDSEITYDPLEGSIKTANPQEDFKLVKEFKDVYLKNISTEIMCNNVHIYEKMLVTFNYL